MNHIGIRQVFQQKELTGDQVFALARSVAYFYQKSNSDQVESLDLIIRLIDRRAEFEALLSGVGRMIDAIAREAGLYPYIVDIGGWRDEVAVELMRAPGLPDIVFHIEQALVYNKLAVGRSVVLSAPTSFGKSLLIDVLIAHRQPETVIVVVPTIALLDEFRRRMEMRFPTYQIISRSREERVNKLAIFIGTQERILERTGINEVDLFIIDEFYKLDLTRNDRRSLALNTVLSKYGRRSKQIYFLGPSIHNVPNLEKLRSDIDFVKTSYSPVTADIIDRTSFGASPEQLVIDIKSVGRSSSLIYVQSPPSASRLTFEILKSKLARRSDFCIELSLWLSEFFHPQWVLVESVARGIGIHHGRIPRSIAHLMIQLFNQGELAAIVCTSSMIEGINTAAENVFIYDRNINTTKLDRFTFDNIKGRAGRMFRHNIGRIFLYCDPPEDQNFDVNIPLFGGDDFMSPELLVQVDDSFLTPSALSRKKAITSSSLLPPALLATWAEFGIDELHRLAEKIKEEIQNSESLILWTGVPSYEQIGLTFGLAWGILKFPKHDIKSPKQLAFFANRLRTSTSIRSYLDGLVHSSGLAAQIEIDRAFNFMRGAEHTFPQVLRALEDVINVVAEQELVNYKVYAAQLQNMFLPGELRALDEFGVPFPLIERLAGILTADDVGIARRELMEPKFGITSALTPFEQRLLVRSLGSG